MKCQGLWGLLFGHHYQARYSTTERERIGTGKVTGDSELISLLFKPLVNSTYECDICTRCGNPIKKPA